MEILKSKNKNKHNLGRLEISRICNQRCVFCSAPPVGGELSFDEVKERMLKLKEEGVTDIMITGGEPTLKKDLFEILDLAQELFHEITIQSNGSTLYNIDFANKFKKFNNLKFNISFHASDEEIFSQLSNAPKTYQNTLKTLENIGRIGVPVFITIVIQKSNYKYLKRHIEFCRSNFPHITHFSFNFIDPIFNALENSWTVPKFSDAAPYMRGAFDRIIEDNCTFRIEKIPLCFLKGYEQYQSNLRRGLFDETRSCSFLVSEKDLGQKKEFVKEQGESSFFYAPKCKECSLLKICPGVNKNYVKIHGYNEIRPVLDRSPEEILEKARKTKTRLRTKNIKDELSLADKKIVNSDYDEDFKERVFEDLKIFDDAIKIKPNKNNVYDTYSFYLMDNIGLKDEKFIYNLWKMHINDIRNNKADNMLSFYIHMPYCKTNCTFCVYPSKTMSNDEQIESYKEFLIEKMKKFSPLFKGIKFKNFYMGGGTPSVFSEKQLDEIFENLFSLFDFEKKGEKAIEFNPSTTTLEKLKILDKHEFNKFSIGVQSLSRRVLRINKRIYQTEKMVEDAIKNFKKTGINYINVDLLLGLKGDSPEEFLKSFEVLTDLQPNNICIYPVKTNDNYIMKNYKNFEEFEKFYYPLFDSVTEKILSVAEKRGYSANFNKDNFSYVKPMIFSKRDQNVKKLDYGYSHFSVENYSIFCLGDYSHSRISGLVDYRYVDKNRKDSMFLKDFSDNHEDFSYDVDIISPRFERVKFIIQNFYNKRIMSRKEYSKRYGDDITQDFPYAIKALGLLGVITLDSETVIFKDMDEKLYYPYLLFFAGRKNVLGKMNLIKD